jgi:DMSO/TMAO reductase YedYZ molybdopterin-dependent catalytic subunit
MAGFGAGLVLTATMLALRLRLDAPTLPERIDDAVLLIIPQWLFSDMIERFRFSAKPLLFVGLVLAQLLLATVGGLVYGLCAVALAARIDLAHPFIAGAIGVFAAVALDFVVLPALGADAPLGPAGQPATAPAIAMTVVPGVAYGLALAVLLHALSPQRPACERLTGGHARRRGITRRAAIAAIVPAVGAMVTAFSLQRLVAGMRPRRPGAASQFSGPGTPTPEATAANPQIAGSPAATSAPSPGAQAATPAQAATSTASPVPVTQGPAAMQPAPPTLTPVSATPRSAATPMIAGVQIPPGVAPRITPTRDFYTISKNFLDPLVRAEQWELTIAGQVERPRTLRLADLRALPSVSQPATLACISNEVGGALIGTATWIGVPLSALLEGAGLRSGVAQVVFRCEDGYVEWLPVARALDPATLLVHTMNGEPLWDVHGFPARLIVPGRYGMKNPKWITRIEATTRPPTGYWTERGWSPDEPIQTTTRIDVPGPMQIIAIGPTPLGGIAFAGDRGIAGVEVSMDDGRTWHAAELEPALGPATWVRWTYLWTPTRPGGYSILARALDGTGAIQTATARGPGPGGATGYARREVTVGP